MGGIEEKERMRHAKLPSFTGFSIQDRNQQQREQKFYPLHSLSLSHTRHRVKSSRHESVSFSFDQRKTLIELEGEKREDDDDHSTLGLLHRMETVRTG